MLAAYEKLGHMKKLATPFNMSKIKARDLAMLNTTDAYKNILYENYRLEQEEIYGVYPPPPLLQPKSEREISSKSLHIYRCFRQRRFQEKSPPQEVEH